MPIELWLHCMLSAESDGCTAVTVTATVVFANEMNITTVQINADE